MVYAGQLQRTEHLSRTEGEGVDGGQSHPQMEFARAVKVKTEYEIKVKKSIN